MRLYYDRDTRSLLCDSGGLEHMVLTEATMRLFREHRASSTSQKPQMTKATAVQIRDIALDIIDNLRADFLAAHIDVADGKETPNA